MKLKPYTSVEQYWEIEEREMERQREAVKAMLDRERPVKLPRYAQIFGWLCAIAAFGILLNRIWVWGCIWFWSNR